MAEYMHLIGAEQIGQAGRNIQSAADTILSAASSMDHSLMAHQRFLDDWLARLDDTLSNRIQQLSVVTGAQ
jgi:hypothetical protein